MLRRGVKSRVYLQIIFRRCRFHIDPFSVQTFVLFFCLRQGGGYDISCFMVYKLASVSNNYLLIS